VKYFEKDHKVCASPFSDSKKDLNDGCYILPNGYALLVSHAEEVEERAVWKKDILSAELSVLVPNEEGKLIFPDCDDEDVVSTITAAIIENRLVPEDVTWTSDPQSGSLGDVRSEMLRAFIHELSKKERHPHYRDDLLELNSYYDPVLIEPSAVPDLPKKCPKRCPKRPGDGCDAPNLFMCGM